MVHNGIEYGDMQLIAETYAILKQALGLGNDEISRLFELWNHGDLNSYLIEITASILRYKEKSGEYLVDKIRDVARQKGTGRWCVEVALNEGEPLTLNYGSRICTDAFCFTRNSTRSGILLSG